MAMMWRIPALAMVFMLGMASAAAAQRRIQVGAKVGPSFSDITLEEDDGQSYHARIAAAGGGFVFLPVVGRLALQVEALSTAKGSRIEEPGENVTQTLMLRYLEFPVLLRVAGPKQGIGTWYFMGGGTFGVRTSAKAQISSVAGSVIAGERNDASAAIERFESGIAVAAGADIGRFMVVEARYARGLTNVNKVPDSPRFTNRALTFLVGIRY